MDLDGNTRIHHPESLYGLLVVDVSAKRQKGELVAVIGIRVISHLWTAKKTVDSPPSLLNILLLQSELE